HARLARLAMLDRPQREEELHRQVRRHTFGGTARRARAELVMRRDTVQYHRGNTLSTLPLPLHELGHAWGLCDAYLPPKDWCHPVGNLRTATEQSIMDLDPPRQQLFLSDVDIEAIQSHARQMGVADERRFRAAA